MTLPIDRVQNIFFIPRLLFVALVVCLCSLLSGFTVSALAQGESEPALQSAPVLTKLADPITGAKKSTGPDVMSKPFWQDLSPMQRISLSPLAANWNTMDEAQKRKWIAISANYPALDPIEQTKLHNRMTEWVSLTYQQRAQARLNFAKSKQLSPSEKTASWQAYQALSAEEKQKLANLAAPKLAGAAIAAKPVPVQKLTAIPAIHPSLPQTVKPGTQNNTVQPHTLLPQAKASAAQAVVQKN